jgi:hypothetical protein
MKNIMQRQNVLFLSIIHCFLNVIIINIPEAAVQYDLRARTIAK